MSAALMEEIASSVPAREGEREASLKGMVVVTGASGQVGRRMLERLRETPAHTVALARRPFSAPALRCYTGSLDSSWARDAIEEADYVVHLAGTLRPADGSYWDANVETAAAVARSLARGAARRVAFLSYVGASADSDNEYLRTKAQAEQILAGTGRELVVFRSTHVVGPFHEPGPTAQAFLARGDRPVLVPGDGQQRVAPLYVDDVVSAVLSALVRGAPGTYDLAGPDIMTLDELVDMLNGGRARIRHVPARLARLGARFIPSLPAAAVDVMLRHSVGDASRAVETFGLKLRSLREQWSGPWI